MQFATDPMVIVVPSSMSYAATSKSPCYADCLDA